MATLPLELSQREIGIRMPLLRREIDVFPPSLFEDSGDTWWVAHVRSRQEKALARYLKPFRVGFYLPQIERRSTGGARTRTSYLPLFPGYLFFRGEAAERLVALRSNLIVRVLEVRDQQLLDLELAQLHALQRSGATLAPGEPLAEGDAVRIKEGPFTGYLGVVVRGANRPRLIVSISVLRKSVSVELDRAAVAVVPPGARPPAAARSAVA
jgi:transcription antitermination factor NusG